MSDVKQAESTALLPLSEYVRLKKIESQRDLYLQQRNRLMEAAEELITRSWGKDSVSITCVESSDITALSAAINAIKDKEDGEK